MPCCCCRCCVWAQDQPIHCCKYCSRIFYVIFVILTTSVLFHLIRAILRPRLCIACAYMGNSQLPTTVVGARNELNDVTTFAHEVLGSSSNIQEIGTSVCTTIEHAVDLISETLGSRALLYEKLDCVINGLSIMPDFDAILQQIHNIERLKTEMPSSASLSSQLVLLNNSLIMLENLPTFISIVCLKYCIRFTSHFFPCRLEALKRHLDCSLPLPPLLSWRSFLISSTLCLMPMRLRQI